MAQDLLEKERLNSVSSWLREILIPALIHKEQVKLLGVLGVALANMLSELL